MPGDHYTYAVRKDYAWGPNGAKTSAHGHARHASRSRSCPTRRPPRTCSLSGQINAASILGPDAARLDCRQGGRRRRPSCIIGEQWYNHGEGHATSDPAVRTALTQALDLAELQKVITSNTGAPAKGLAILAPAGCTGDSVKGNVPATDTAAAGGRPRGCRLGQGLRRRLRQGRQEADGQLPLRQRAGHRRLRRGRARRGGVDQARRRREGQGRVDHRPAADPVRHGCLGHRLGADQRQHARPGGAVLLGPRPEGRRHELRQHQERRTTPRACRRRSSKSGAEGCPDWQAAEASLFKAADVVPFANNVLQTFHKGADFEVTGWIEPTSIRMLG